MRRPYVRSLLPWLAALLLGLAAYLPRPATAQSAERSAILAVAFERGDETAASVDSADVTASSAGDALAIDGLGDASELRGQWEIAIYVDQELTATGPILRFLETLAGEAVALTDLGEVQLVLAGEEHSTVVRTSDSHLLEQVLFQQSLRSAGEHGLRSRRLDLLKELGQQDADGPALATAALAQEVAVLGRRHDDLVHWIAQQGRSTAPRAIFFLSQGTGAELESFYRPLLEDVDAVLSDQGGLPDLHGLAQVLASYGWLFMPSVVPPSDEDVDDNVSLRTNQSIGFKIGFGGRKDPEDEFAAEPPELFLEAGRLEAMGRLAELTGGRLTTALEALPASVAALGQRRPLEVALPEAPDEPIPLVVETIDPRIDVRAPSWFGGSPETVAEVRIRRSLEGEGDRGELPLRARIYLDPAQLDSEPAEFDLLVDLSEVEGDGPIPLRVSVGVHQQDGELLIEHEIVTDARMEGGTFALNRPLPLPSTTDATVVVVEDMAGGVWGENFAEFVTRTAAVAAAAPSIPEPETSTPTGPALRIQPLPADARSGKVRIRTTARPDVDEVRFLLDGRSAGSKRRPPFDLRLDLGKTVEQRSIIAIAYDSSGREIGRDGIVVNEAATSFWVQISEPTPSDRVGPVDVVTSTRVPEGDRLERIDYYWNDSLIGTTREAPHRERILIPVDRPAGYIRVVATLANGKTAEDVVLMNTQRFESQINVELVELYVVVTDNLGRPVLGLDRGDFIVREEQEVQNVESFAVAGDLPLTLGLAIDSSLSLFKRLPEVQAAASHFVKSLRPDRDRAFLVEYGSSPRLVQPITSELDRISHGIRSLRASGNTAVWEGVSLSLGELQESVGRKALVVFYDGDDEDESYSFKRTLDLARKSRIPIYLIVMNNEAARTQGKGFSVRSRIARLDQLARTGGGRVYYVRTDEDLTPVFEDISEELRGHYLLTYYPQRPVQQPEWRPISVELTRSDLTARTLSGYGG